MSLRDGRRRRPREPSIARTQGAFVAGGYGRDRERSEALVRSTVPGEPSIARTQGAFVAGGYGRDRERSEALVRSTVPGPECDEGGRQQRVTPLRLRRAPRPP